MATLSGILNTGEQALLLQQLAMQVVGNNTANVSTAGFSRRRIEFGTAPGISTFGKWTVGSGVDVSELGRVRDRILDDQIRRGNGTLGYWSQRDDQLGKVEQIFSEMGGSAISDQLQQFWAAWQDLSNDPESGSSRQALLEKAQSLTANVQRTYGALAQQRQAVDEEFASKIGDVNALTSQIAELNTRIVNAETAHSEASDLRDARDLAVDKLSKLIDINVQENSDGAINVYHGGQIIVQLDRNVRLTSSTVSDNGYTKTVAQYENGTPVTFSGGEMKSLLDVRDGDILSSMKDLDQFAVSLTSRINEVHRTGYGLTNTNGIDFFDSNVTGAANFHVSDMVAQNVNLIATASAPNAPGDNSLVLQIAGIQHEKLMDGGQSTIDEFYTNSALRLGSAKSYASSQLTVEQSAADTLENRRQQISGVSMDEEMAHLIQVQKAYDAAAKIITTVNTMMDTVLNMTA